MRHFLLVALFLGLASVALAEERMHVLFILNPNRPDPILRKDAVAVVREVQAAQEGDLLEGIDLNGKEIFRLDLREGGSRLVQMRSQSVAISAVGAYYKQILQEGKQAADLTLDIPAALKHVEDRLRFQGVFQVVYLVLFTSGFHHTAEVDFRGLIPGDSWLVHPVSPFVHLGSLPVQAMMITDAQEFASLVHQDGVMRFYALLFARHRGNLVGYTTLHEQVRQVIGGRVTKPLITDLHMESSGGDLVLRRPPQITDPDAR